MENEILNNNLKLILKRFPIKGQSRNLHSLLISMSQPEIINFYKKINEEARLHYTFWPLLEMIIRHYSLIELSIRNGFIEPIIPKQIYQRIKKLLIPLVELFRDDNISPLIFSLVTRSQLTKGENDKIQFNYNFYEFISLYNSYLYNGDLQPFITNIKQNEEYSVYIGLIFGGSVSNFRLSRKAEKVLDNILNYISFIISLSEFLNVSVKDERSKTNFKNFYYDIIMNKNISNFNDQFEKVYQLNLSWQNVNNEYLNDLNYFKQFVQASKSLLNIDFNEGPYPKIEN